MVLESVTGMLTGMIDASTGLLLQSMQISTALTIGLLFVMIVIAYKMFKIAIKAMLVGGLAALIPVAAVIFGIDIGIALTVDNMVWFAILGISAYLVYSSVSMGMRTVRMAMKPFGFMFRNKQKEKIIIREVEKKEKP